MTRSYGDILGSHFEVSAARERTYRRVIMALLATNACMLVALVLIQAWSV